MSKGQFRLERIYQLRAKLCQMQEMKTKKANHLRQQSEQALEQAQINLDESARNIVQSGYSGCKASELKKRWYHKIRLRKEESSRQEDLQQKQQFADECKNKLRRAKRRKETLQKLKEKSEEEARQNRLKREQKYIDEMATQQYINSKGGED